MMASHTQTGNIPASLSLFYGGPETANEWESTCVQYAKSRDLFYETRQLDLAGGTVCRWGWMATHALEAKRYYWQNGNVHYVSTLRNLTLAQQQQLTLEKESGEASSVNTTIIRVDTRQSELRIDVPIATPEQLFYICDRRGLFATNDLRLLLAFDGIEIAPAAIYSLFQIGGIPAPLSFSKNIHRIPGGMRLTNRIGKSTQLQKITFSSDLQDLGGNGQVEAYVERRLNDVLHQTAKQPLLYFSGGVDSSLLAAQLKDIDREAQLFNFSFGPEDEEASFALRMAETLGYRCEQVHLLQPAVLGMMQKIGHDYSYPFADYSCIPTNLLVQASIEHSPPTTVVEGTAGDGVFGAGSLFSWWHRAYALPRGLTGLASMLYKYGGYWRSDAQTRKALRFLRTSHQMTFTRGAVLAQNTLDGIAYKIPETQDEEIEEALGISVTAFSTLERPREHMGMTDVLHVCAGIYAAKSFDPLRQAGFTPIYPFLERPMLELIFQISPEIKYREGVAKYIPKKMLARRVPAPLVYRKKSGFRPPIGEILTYPEVRNFIGDMVLAPSNELLVFVNKRVTGRIFERAFAGKLFNKEAINYLWALTFASIWVAAQRH